LASISFSARLGTSWSRVSLDRVTGDVLLVDSHASMADRS
jgi:hypothetical protein